MVEIRTPPISNENHISEDIVLPFMIDISNINGRALRLNNTISTIINQHNYPTAVAKILTEQLMLTALLGATIKEKKHKVSIQTQSQGLIKLVVSDINPNGILRGYVSFYKEQLDKVKAPKFNALIQKAAMVVTTGKIGTKEQSQSIIAIEGNSLSSSFELYFKQSKQIKVMLKNTLKQNKKQKTWHASCILLEFLPTNETNKVSEIQKTEEEWWERAKAYLETVTNKELMDTNLPLKDLLYRLFHEDGVRVFSPQTLHNGCSCSRDKLATFIDQLSPEEKLDLQTNNKITFTCEFCNNTEIFDIVANKK